MVCCFFGHSDCYGLNANALENAIEELINKGVDTFYVGHQGHFDSLILGCLVKLREIHSHIIFRVVLAYLPTKNYGYDPYYGCSIYPEGLETGHPRFAIERRNMWMINHSDYCLCYVNRSWGGAYKFARQAKKNGLVLINLGNLKL